MFWEYDPRIVRRWNVDTKPVAYESPYSVNGNTPIFYVDPLGDFKNKFGALMYKITHGGKMEEILKQGNIPLGKKYNIKEME